MTRLRRCGVCVSVCVCVCVCVYTTEYYSAIRKNEILPFAAMWMDLENIMLSEISQTEKDKYDITYMWNLKNNTNECYTKQKRTHRYRKQTCIYQRGDKKEEGQIRSMGLKDSNYCI